MGTTTNGLPYPEPTDPIAAGADAIRALAEAVDIAHRYRVKQIGSANGPTADLGGITAGGILIAETVIAFTAVAGRSYRMTADVNVNSPAGVCIFTASIVRSSDLVAVRSRSIGLPANTLGSTTVTHVATGLLGAQSYGIHITCNIGNGALLGAFNRHARFEVQEILGPNLLAPVTLD